MTAAAIIKLALSIADRVAEYANKGRKQIPISVLASKAQMYRYKQGRDIQRLKRKKKT